MLEVHAKLLPTPLSFMRRQRLLFPRRFLRRRWEKLVRRLPACLLVGCCMTMCRRICRSLAQENLPSLFHMSGHLTKRRSSVVMALVRSKTARSRHMSAGQRQHHGAAGLILRRQGEPMRCSFMCTSAPLERRSYCTQTGESVVYSPANRL